MKSNNTQTSLPLWTGLSVIFILTIFSIFTYKERMLFVDPAWVVFNIINTKSMLIPGYRFGAFITQVFPLMGVWFGLSLKTILIIYSFSFYCFFLSAALVIGLKFKQGWLVVLQAIYLTLFVSDVYYWPVDEVHQGITWMFLFLGLYLFQAKNKKIIAHVFLVLFAALAISSHLLVSIAFLFLWTVIHSSKKLKDLTRDRRFICYSILILAFIAFRVILSDANGYDNAKLEGVRDLSFKSVFLAFSSGQAKTFLKLLFMNYWVAIPIFFAGIILLLKSRQYLNLFSMILLSIGYFILICITFPDGYDRTMRFYFEAQWVGLSIIVATPFVVWLMQNKKLGWLLIVVFGVRLVYIFFAFGYFNNRLKNLEAVVAHLKSKGETKALIIESNKTTNSYFIMGWGLPVESILLSSLNGDKILTTFKISEDKKDLLQDRKSFYTSFGIASMGTLNKQYFRLDTSRQYQVIEGLNGLIKN